MRKYINIINEGIDAPTFDPTREKSDAMREFEDMFNSIFAPLKHRAAVEDVYFMVIDGAPFDDAVHVISDRDEMDPMQLRQLVINDYKQLRGDSDLYATEFGHSLVAHMNPAIQESLDEIVENETLMERGAGTSLKVGAYYNAQGARLLVLRSPNDAKHHMVVNQKGEVVATPYGTAAEVDAKLKADGFQGAIQE